MAERRSLGDAMEMTPAKLAFIKGDSEAKALASPKPQAAKKQTVEKTLEVSQPQITTKTEKEPRRGAQSRQSIGSRRVSLERSDVLDQVLVPKTIRLPHQIVHALDRAYLEQKLKYAKPDTLQEIAKEAITDWLQKSGYLDS